MNYQYKNFIIAIYAMPVLDSRMYIIANDQNPSEAIIIDPLVHKDAVPYLEQFTHATILLTHSHYDHISGVNWVKEQLPSSVLCSQTCADKINNPNKNFSAFSTALVIGKNPEEQKQCMEFFDLHYSCTADDIFDKETSFDFGSYHVSITYCPGHSDCSQCILFTTANSDLPKQILFTGDSLVNGYETITRLPSGSKKDYLSITKPFIESFSDDTLVMPGHGNWDILESFFVRTDRFTR